MWMMGYDDGGEFNTNIQDPFNGRKFRPLVPRQATNHLLTLNHHLAMVEQNKRESSTQQVVVSSRWNPTPEQLRTLEDLYRSGTRTPSADQIQHITAQLRRYGKIEGKNVFYWFQNHKARERQKRRRHLQSPSDQPPPHNAHAHEKYHEENAKELPAGVNRTVLEVEETKKWASPTNSSTIAEKNVSTKGAAKAESDADGWLQFEDEAELLQQRRNATWQMMHLSCSSSSSSSPSATDLINPSSVPTVTTNVPSPVVGLTILQPDLMIKTTPGFIDVNFVDPTYNTLQNLDQSAVDGGGGGEAQTLQLFPLGRKEECEDEKEEEEEPGAVIMNGTSTNVTPNYQFFEFLPLKN